jgi:oligopeptide/dipeptide ABC transporter ATP-binding protein
MASGRQVLEVSGLSVDYKLQASAWFGRKPVLRAVDGISFSISHGEALGLVGESGCGKSSVGRAVLRLQPVAAGEVRFNGVDLLKLGPDALRQMRRRMQMVFQDSYASLNPYMRVRDIIAEPLSIFGIDTGRTRRRQAAEMLAAVGLDTSAGERYPHEFSGGQRQRINIARALILSPELIVCDEPVSALDVSIQETIMLLLASLRQAHDLTFLFISHDLAVVRDFCDRVAVMYLGRIVEVSGSDDLYDRPLHPYTQALIVAIPVPDPEIEAARALERVELSGEVVSALDRHAGCCFSGRCPKAGDVERTFGIDCANTPPILTAVQPGHDVACHLYEACRPASGCG